MPVAILALDWGAAAAFVRFIYPRTSQLHIRSNLPEWRNAIGALSNIAGRPVHLLRHNACQRTE
jgi:hypothetical protein